MTEKIIKRPLTFGEKYVGLNLIPGENIKVDEVKKLYAEIIDYLNDERSDTRNSAERNRLLSIAITEAQSAQMWAIKAITWIY